MAQHLSGSSGHAVNVGADMAHEAVYVPWDQKSDPIDGRWKPHDFPIFFPCHGSIGNHHGHVFAPGDSHAISGQIYDVLHTSLSGSIYFRHYTLSSFAESKPSPIL
jgi:hypothetical protein